MATPPPPPPPAPLLGVVVVVVSARLWTRWGPRVASKQQEHRAQVRQRLHFFCRLLNLNITIILFTKTGSGQTWGKHNSKKTFYRFLAVAGEISAPFSNDAAPNRTEAAHTFQTAAAAEEEDEAAAAEEDEICPVRSRLPNCVFSPFCLTSVPSLSWQNVWCPGPRASLSWQNGRVTSSSACSSLHYTLYIIYYIIDYCIITSSSACLECVRPFGMCVRIL
jgi:hypothetical protein